MILLPSDKKLYPKLNEFLRNRIPAITANGAIVAALKKFGHMTDAQVTSALAWGQPPYVSVVDFALVPCGNDPSGNPITNAYGCTRASIMNAIEVARNVAEQFEKNPNQASDNKNIRGTTLYVLGATLLHELCHWGNFQNGFVETKGTEMGLSFENAVYGKTIW